MKKNKLIFFFLVFSVLFTAYQALAASGSGSVTVNVNVTLTVGTTGNGSGTTTGAGTYAYNQVVAITASPDASSNFIGWTGDPDCTDGSVIMNANKTCTANFTLKQFTVTPSIGLNGSVSPSTPQTVNYGSTVSFTVTPNSGYTASVSGCGIVSTSNPYTTTAISSDCTATFTFSQMSGTLTPSSQTCTISAGGTSCSGVDLSWTTTNPVSTSSVTNNGGATPSSTTGLNGSQSFTVPYYVAGAGSTTFYLFNNSVQLATAVVNTVCTPGTDWVSGQCRTKPTIIVTQASNGTISPAGTTSVVYGTNSTTISLTPNSGYVVASHIINGVSIATNSTSYTFTNITSDQTFSATFVSNTFPVSGSVISGSGSVSVTSTPIASGTSTTVTVTPSAGNFTKSATGSAGCNGGTLSGNIFTTGLITSACDVSFTLMYGSLSTSNCTIVVGDSSCPIGLSWDTTNPISTSAVTTPVSITVATGNSGSTTYSISDGSRNFYLYNNGNLLYTVTATATCAIGSSWNGNFCASTSVTGNPVYGSCSGGSLWAYPPATSISTGVYLYYDENLQLPYTESQVSDEVGTIYWMNGNQVGAQTGDSC